jgi:prepilin-type N-terminal cleavage/methylation domain-containing protein
LTRVGLAQPLQTVLEHQQVIMVNKVSTERGFALTELIVVVAMIGVLSLLAVPSLLSYWQSSSLAAGAEQLAAVMNRARQLAVRSNTSVCVERTGTSVRMRTVSCGGTIWTGVGTDSAGLIQIANNLQVSAATASAIFTNVGGANPAATYTVTDPGTNRSRTVVVSTTGQVTIQ